MIQILKMINTVYRHENVVYNGIAGRINSPSVLGCASWILSGPTRYIVSHLTFASIGISYDE